MALDVPACLMGLAFQAQPRSPPPRDRPRRARREDLRSDVEERIAGLATWMVKARATLQQLHLGAARHGSPIPVVLNEHKPRRVRIPRRQHLGEEAYRG